MKDTRKTFASIIASLFVVAVYADEANWYGEQWYYRKKITIPATEVSEDLNNFPVLLATTDSDFKKAKSDGADFVITASDGTTPLDRELDFFNSATGQLAFWFRVPTLSSTSDNEFYLYYGNADASETDDTTVWSSDYRMVQHMDQDPENSSPQIIDSTANNVNLTCQGSVDAMDSNDLVTGKIGNALDLDGSDDQLYRADDGTLDPSSSFTVSAWVWHDDNGADNIIRKLDSKNNGYQGYFLGTTANVSTYGNDAFVLGINGVNTPNYVSTSWFSTGAWHHVAGVVDRGTSPDSMRLYVDGALVNTNPDVDATKDILNGPNFYIAVPIGGSGASRWDGKIDELRIIFAARNTSWIATAYANQNDPGGFMTLADEESTLPASGTLLIIR